MTGALDVVDFGSRAYGCYATATPATSPFDEQLPGGAFGDNEYTTQLLHPIPGDRLVFVSDGIYDTLSPTDDHYGGAGAGRGAGRPGAAPRSRRNH